MEQQRGRLGHMELNSDLTPSDEAVSQFEYRFREGPDLEVTTPDPQGSLDGPLKIEHDEEENDGQQNLRCDANVHSSDSNQADETNDGQDQRSIVDDSTIVIKQEMSTTLQLRASGVVHKIEQQDDTTRINTGVNANAGIKTKETVVQDIDEASTSADMNDAVPNTATPSPTRQLSASEPSVQQNAKASSQARRGNQAPTRHSKPDLIDIEAYHRGIQRFRDLRQEFQRISDALFRKVESDYSASLSIPPSVDKPDPPPKKALLLLRPPKKVSFLLPPQYYIIPASPPTRAGRRVTPPRTIIASHHTGDRADVLENTAPKGAKRKVEEVVDLPEDVRSSPRLLKISRT